MNIRWCISGGAYDRLTARELSKLSRVSGVNQPLGAALTGFARGANSGGSAAFSALIWWLVPLIAVTGAIIYVIWVSRFKAKFENETNRSVTSFQSFQRSFDGSSGQGGSVQPILPASRANSVGEQDLLPTEKPDKAG